MLTKAVQSNNPLGRACSGTTPVISNRVLNGNPGLNLHYSQTNFLEPGEVSFLI